MNSMQTTGCISFALYWAWVFSAIVGSSLLGEFDMFTNLGIRLAGAWGIALGLLVLCFLVPRASVASSRLLSVLSALFPALYGIAFVIPGADALGPVALGTSLFLAGAASSLVLVGIGGGFALYPRRYGIVATCLASSLGAFLSLLVNSAAHEISAACITLLIPLSVVLFRRARLVPAPETRDDCKLAFSALKPYRSLLAFMFLYSALFGLVLVAGTLEYPPGAAVSPVLMAICVPGVIVLLLLSGTRVRVDAESLQRLLLALAAIGLVPLIMGIGQLDFYLFLFLTIAFGVFDIANFVTLYEIIRENNFPNLATFAIGRVSAELGIAIGWSVGLGIWMFSGGNTRWIEMAATAIVALIVTGLALSSRASREPDSSGATSAASADSLIANPYLDFERAVDEICSEYDLSPREREVFGLLATGRTPKRISEKLFVSESTAKSHCHRIYQKVGVHNQQDLLDIVESRQQAIQKDRWNLMP